MEEIELIITGNLEIGIYFYLTPYVRQQVSKAKLIFDKIKI